ncbi:MAG: 6-phosphogluconolactonase, partial [Chloroflexi bacterium]|nr:6-phosphogluconolactonase [Chloroflexota bacterium]
MRDPFTLHVFANDVAFNEAATRLLTMLAQEAMAQNGRFSIALSGGGTPAGIYKLWGERPFVDEMPWHNTHLFWGDERLVP